jgi:hypothetical protein
MVAGGEEMLVAGACNQTYTMTRFAPAPGANPMTNALSGRPKVAIVTGASSGIGLEMVKSQESRALLLVESWTIPVADRPPDRPLAILQARRTSGSAWL